MPKYTYLFLYSPKLGSYEKVLAFVDSSPEIQNWFHCLPNSFFIVSERTATELSRLVKAWSKGRGRFIILTRIAHLATFWRVNVAR
jgi:hypothetical protein